MCQSEFALESNINLLAEKVGISPWEIRFRNAIEPGKALPNGQIADCSTALKETLLAVKDVYEQNADHAGIACAMKNSGVGVGLPDKGRCKLAVRNGVVELYSAASDIGQGCATVFLQMLAEATGLPVQLFLSHEHGGSQQIGARIAYNEIDMVLFFSDPQSNDLDADLKYITTLCDQYNIPFATNVATAEILIHGLERGDLDWRDIINPKTKPFTA